MSDRTTAALQPTLRGYESRARHVLSTDRAAYFFGGAADELTLEANQRAFSEIELLPRALRDMRGGSAGLTLLGQPMAHPVLVAPVAYQKLVHPDGEAAMAIGAAAQGTHMVLSTQSSVDAAEARRAGAYCTWFQLYWRPTREDNLRLVQRMADLGYTAIVLTIDAPVQGVRDRETRTGFRLPADISAVNLENMRPPQFAPLGDDESILFDRIAHIAPEWADVEWLCENSPLPVILKGIVHPGDAHKAVLAGARAIIVSNHGGRVLDTIPASIRLLPAVVKACDGAIPVLMDGGVRRGTDILKALALGATAVLVGRPVIAGLAVAGAAGVSHVLRLLHDEFEIAMMLTGCRTLNDITPDILYRPDQP
ncbi:alpha-hydroxy acid oxidase [Hoeflea ulvae]|uniref:Alpha-hydroxy-acid oxidizing protein n=1 Tax=Hoeflea ulvae TaxID=2983764 RepID=A0ABT3YMT3_9HYPH|nr:alpha-hydroxy acid oxidase [Hoeflea ulvae]MCY0096887.1 alpha-hydroxy-acid oxidizing protein [Hoeflea ulvae]